MQNDTLIQPDTNARCHLAWGRRGARQAAARGHILVVVDVLSFATATATAVAHGARIRPCTSDDDIEQLAFDSGAKIALRRQDAHEGYSLSPLSFVGMPAGANVLLPSPNGATCSRYGRQAPHLLVGALVNASAVASAVDRLLAHTELSVSVIACGERWNDDDEDGPLRFAIEDLLGAGAILASLECYSLSAEALLAATTFRAVQDDLGAMLWTCESGRELRERGFGDDVRFAAQFNKYQAVPILHNEWLVEQSVVKH